MTDSYRQPGKVLPDRGSNVTYLTEQAQVLSLRAKKLARNAKIWAYIAVGVSLVNIIFQVILLIVKYRWL